ncbi:MAG: UDP-N-acetylmuramate dehydrogenase [Leptolyngbyaceae bacterium]|nr:UDP-N-acetylmuramate dehydrogenase [Leptolyngbyaceae bacterium]
MSAATAAPEHLGRRKATPDGRQQRAGAWRVLGRTPEPITLERGNCSIQRQVSLAKFTTFKVGGPADLYVAPRTLQDLQLSLDWANQNSEPVTLLGAGSNLLVGDRGISGLVLSTRYLRHAHFDDSLCQLTVGAGDPIARLAWKAAEKGWSGLEWAAGIPGTVGGAVVMNAGAHKLCTADVFLNAHVLSPDNQQQILNHDDLGFQYRTSMLQGNQLIVTQATFQLEPGHPPEAVLARTRSFLDYRHRTQPYNMPNCGSVFRNPPSHSAGWLIEQTGLKGYQIGAAQVANLHANFILNLGQAKAQDIRTLIEHIQATIEQQWSLHLHPEVKFMGQF